MKFILHPDDGLRPRWDRDNPATRITDAQIDTAIDDANSFLASYGRGYRLRVVEMLNIGGLNQDHSNQPNTKPGYYAIQTSASNTLAFFYPDGYVNPLGETPLTGPLIDVLDQNARSTAATRLDFKWNDHAVNVFVPSDWRGGGGIAPDWGDAAGFGVFEGWLFLHELGHYYNLIHTFGEDGVADTLVDPASVSQEAIAQELYSKSYSDCSAAELAVVDAEYYRRARNSIAAANNTPPNDVLSSSTYSLLPPSEQQLVDDVFFNIMSYYDPPHRNQFVTRMTEGQADRMTDAANSSAAPYRVRLHPPRGDQAAWTPSWAFPTREPPPDSRCGMLPPPPPGPPPHPATTRSCCSARATTTSRSPSPRPAPCAPRAKARQSSANPEHP